MPPIGVFTILGDTLYSTPLFPRFHKLHEQGRVVELYHYTDRSGFEALTSKIARFLPSLGAIPRSVSFSHIEHLFPTPAFGETDKPQERFIRDDIGLLITLAATVGPQLMDLSSAMYGPGWYLTDLPPRTGTRELLHCLWGGNLAKLERTAFWITLRVSEFKVRLPTPSRPHVRFLPICDTYGNSGEGSFYGRNISTIFAVAGGSRDELQNGQVRVTRNEHEPRAVIPSLQFGVEVWEELSELQRQNILRYLGIGRISSTLPPSAIRAVDFIHAEFQRGELKKALLFSEEFTARFPDVAELWSNRGAVLAKLGRREEAIQCYFRSIELRREYQPAWINLAASLTKLGRGDEALCCINEAISQDPNNSDAWFNRGTALANLNEWHAAADAFDEAVKLNPHSAYANRATDLAKYCRERSRQV